jgi:opacity protein-like surface antigen
MSRFITKTFVALLIVAGIVSVSRAQDENIIRPSTKAGSAAWVFSFGGLGTMSMGSMPVASITRGDGNTVPVAGIGYKYYLADDMALRATLAFSTTSSGDEDPTKSSTGKTTTTNFGIGVGIEMHTRAVYSTSPYFGAQIAFGSASSDNKITPSGGTSTEKKSSGSSFGIGVLAGFDWYFTRGIAVGAEYMLGFTSASSSVTTNSTTTDLPSATTIGISNGGNVHLVVHF